MFARFNLRSTVAFASMLAASLPFATPSALAQGSPVVVYAQPSDVRSERVPYGDLNLADESGQRTLMHRVSGAVKHVCLYEPGLAGLADHGYFRCADFAWKGARPQMAQAIARAREIALNGSSTIAAQPITIAAR